MKIEHLPASFLKLAICLLQFSICNSLVFADPTPLPKPAESAVDPGRPWLPPFGLDRVGHDPSLVFDADALARSDQPSHPVDLGTIFTPRGWLLLGPGQSASVEVAAISRDKGVPAARVQAWFESSPGKRAETLIPMGQGERVSCRLPLDRIKGRDAKDILRVSITDGGGAELWHKKIPVMRVANPPKLPEFGATELKLRYDLPIIVNSSETGQLDMGKIGTLDYEKGWDPKLNDVVVSLPGGARFVFWRGSSYIPFWAGPNNTGFCYEWAETGPPPDGFVDSVEPLMDKELRYGRVEIVESTPARVHVRWTYQSTDFNYKVWGDQAVEDFYFYPDGYGTRALSLKKNPATQYELSEFIILSAPGMRPFEFIPREAVEMAYLSDGGKHTFRFPADEAAPDRPAYLYKADRAEPVVYRIRSHKNDKQTALYFHPSKDHFPMLQFGSFYEKGVMVTPAYWGSHWPLLRGKSTGYKIDDLADRTPAHNSLMSWAQNRKPDSDSRGTLTTIDTLGRSAPMVVEKYVWLIGMTADPDPRVIQWCKSFAQPPAIEAGGATLDWDTYIPARRAIRLRVNAKNVSLLIKPGEITINPVFELLSTPGKLKALRLDGRTLGRGDYAWDGQTLWINATISQPQKLEIEFR